jgi:hypothetical protein
MADHELIDDSERDRFAGTSATSPGTDRVDDRREPLTERHDSDPAIETERPARFNRDEVVEDDRRDTPTRY